MDSGILFTEKQKFKQWWLWLLLIALNIFFVYSLIDQVILEQPEDVHLQDTYGLMAVTGMTLLMTFLFYNFQLHTRIHKDGIYVRFRPFHLKYRFYPWEKLVKVYVRSYSPITEYGGWGIRLGFFGRGKAYNISGNMGLQLELDSGKRILIGTQKPVELEDALKNSGHLIHP